MSFEISLKDFLQKTVPWTVNMLIRSQAHVMELYVPLSIMNPGVCTMSLFADYMLTIFSFSHTKTHATKFNLDVNLVKVKPASFE